MPICYKQQFWGNKQAKPKQPTITTNKTTPVSMFYSTAWEENRMTHLRKCIS